MLTGFYTVFGLDSRHFLCLAHAMKVFQGLKEQGILEDRLQLLVNITGAFRPGVLTALVGVSGAGKTTLMDVLAGRKTGGTIEGDVYISGFPKRQETFARISGYCEQNDVHSPCLTVVESLLFSACLRLPSDIESETQRVTYFPNIYRIFFRMLGLDYADISKILEIS